MQCICFNNCRQSRLSTSPTGQKLSSTIYQRLIMKKLYSTNGGQCIAFILLTFGKIGAPLDQPSIKHCFYFIDCFRKDMNHLVQTQTICKTNLNYLVQTRTTFSMDMNHLAQTQTI